MPPNGETPDDTDTTSQKPAAGAKPTAGALRGTAQRVAAIQLIHETLSQNAFLRELEEKIFKKFSKQYEATLKSEVEERVQAYIEKYKAEVEAEVQARFEQFYVSSAQITDDYILREVHRSIIAEKEALHRQVISSYNKTYILRSEHDRTLSHHIHRDDLETSILEHDRKFSRYIHRDNLKNYILRSDVQETWTQEDVEKLLREKYILRSEVIGRSGALRPAEEIWTQEDVDRILQKYILRTEVQRACTQQHRLVESEVNSLCANYEKSHIDRKIVDLTYIPRADVATAWQVTNSEVSFEEAFPRSTNKAAEADKAAQIAADGKAAIALQAADDAEIAEDEKTAPARNTRSFTSTVQRKRPGVHVADSRKRACTGADATPTIKIENGASNFNSNYNSDDDHGASNFNSNYNSDSDLNLSDTD